MLNNLLQIHFKLLQKKAIPKIAEANGDLIGNEIADRIIGIARSKSVTPTQTKSTFGNLLKIPKEISIPRKKTKNY